MDTYFISDLHLGHANCIMFDERPWSSVSEMDDGIIDLWNSRVQKDDHVYVLGDFAYRNRMDVSEYLGRMNGIVHLIRGNHDKKTPEYEKYFAEVADYADIPVNVFGMKRRAILSHYFVPFYDGARHGAFMLHGHTHKTRESTIEEELKEKIRNNGLRCEAYNVGCMWQDYMPQTLEEIIKRQKRTVQI